MSLYIFYTLVRSFITFEAMRRPAAEGTKAVLPGKSLLGAAADLSA